MNKKNIYYKIKKLNVELLIKKIRITNKKTLLNTKKYIKNVGVSLIYNYISNKLINF